MIQELTAAGFFLCGGKGSHRNFRHVKGTRITLSGPLGDDALPYQERAVRLAIQEVQDEAR